MKKWIVGLGILILTGCVGDPPVAPHISIFELPENITLCEGEEFQISPEPVDTENFSYQWFPADIFSDPTSPFQTIKGEKDGEYYLKVTDKKTGMSLIKKVNVKVNPAPAGSAGPDKVICGGESVQIGTDGNPDYMYFWTPNTGLENPYSSVTLAHPVEDTTYTLTITDPVTGCSFSDSVTVYVNPGVHAYFVPPPPTCLKDMDGNYITVNFYDGSTGPVTSWLWNFGDGNISDLKNPSHIFSHDGSYEVSLSVTSDAGCSSTYSDIVKILPVPTIFSIISSPQTRCGPGEVEFGALVGGGTPPYQYLWDFGNGITSTSPSPRVTYLSPGEYTIRLFLSDANGCGTSAETSIEVLNSPVANFIVGNTCHLDKYGNKIPVEPVNTSAGNIVSVLWDFGDGTTSTIFSPSHIYESPGDYLITLTVEEESGCIDSITHPVRVYPSPEAVSLTATPQFLCGGGEAQFTFEYIGGTAPFNHYWDFGSGSFVSGASSAVHIYSSTGSYNLRARVVDSNGCMAEENLLVNVYSNPSVFLSLNPSSLCLGSETTIAGSYSSPYPVTYYSISTGDGNTFPVSSTYYTYSSSGTYTVSFIAFDNNGCYSEATSPVWVKPSPVANFTSDAPVCYGDSVNLINTSSGADFYQWDFGDGGSSTEENPSHFYINPGTYYVTLNAFNSHGCSDSVTLPVTIHNSPIADFDIEGNQCVNNILNTRNYSIGADSFLWSFGNGVTSTLFEPTITYENSGIYSISLTAYVSETGCYDTHERIVDITNPPSVILGNDKTVARGGQTTIGGSVSGGVPPYTYFWEEAPVRNYISSITEPYPLVTIPSDAPLETITYTLSVTDVKGCFDPSISMDSMNIFITDALSVSAGADRTICEGESVQIGFPASGGVEPYTYSWSPSDWLSDPSTSPTIATPSLTITYTLTVTDSASPPNTATDTVTIYVNPNPSALFITPFSQERCGTGSVDFSAEVTGGTPPYSFLWDYGDGFTEHSSSSVSHNYSSSGTYTVLLSVKDTNSCPPEPLTATSSVSIRVPPEALFTSDSPVCFHDGYENRISINFTDLSSSDYAPIVSYLWDFGDPFTSSDTSTEREPSYIYTNPGNYISTLLVQDFYGCYDIYSSPVTIYTNPIAGFSATTPQCLSLSVQFTDTSSGTGLSYLYDFGDSYTSTEPSPSHLYPSEGTYIASLLVRDINLCEDNYSSVISIINPADAGADGWVYTGGCLTIGSPPYPDFSYQWSSDPYDPSLSGQEEEAQPTVCPYKTTTYTLNVTSPYGCYGTDSVQIAVYIYVSYVYPEPGTTVNYTNRKILLSFSEPMSSSTINTTSIKLIQIDPITEEETEIAGSVQYDERTRTAIFTPSSSLQPGGLYEIRVFSDPVTGVKSIYGNLLKEDFGSSFDVTSTAGSDTSPPSLIFYSPTGTNVPINAGVYAVFDEIIDPLTVDESTFYIMEEGSSTPVTATVIYDIPSKTIFLNPATDFSPTTTYEVYISGIKDLAGNTLNLSPAWSFTTGSLPDTIPPEVISVFPPDGSTADPTTSIYAYFSEAIDPSTLNSTTFKLFDPNGNEVSGTITYDSVNYIAIFTPQNYLEGWTTYTAYIDEVMDTAGNPMTAPYIWTFTASAPAWEPGDNPSNYAFQNTCPIGGGTASGNELWVEDYNDYYSAPFSWAYYVPAGPGSRSNDCYLGSNDEPPIDLSNYSNYAKLVFYQKRYLRSGDYGYVEVSLDGTNWTTVATFGGINTAWTKTEIDLSSYIGQSIKIRFRLVTNNQIPSKYWKIDEIIVTGN